MGAFWGSLAALGIGGSELFGRRVADVAGAITSALVLQVFGTATALVSLLFVTSEIKMLDLLWGALSGVFMAIGLVCYFGGLRRSSATVVSPTVATLSAVIPFVYTLVRGADISTSATVGALIAFVGLAVIAAGSGSASGLRAGLVWGIASGLGYGIGLSWVIEVSDAAGSWPAVTQRGIGVVIMGVAAVSTKCAIVPPAGQRMNGFLGGAAGGLASVFALIGFSIDAAPTVVTLSMFPLVSVVVGFMYFGDSVSRRQVVGITLVLAGIAAVVVG